MASNLAINAELLKKLLGISGLKTKKDILHFALREFVDHRKEPEIINIFGTTDPDPGYNYKKGRNR